MLDTYLRPGIQKVFDVMARPLIAWNLSPTFITLAAAVLGFIGCAFTAVGGFPFRMAALALLAVSGLLDILDGTVARATGRVSPLGALLDLILDRVIEICFITAFAFAFPKTMWPAMVFLALAMVNFSTFLLAGKLFPNIGKKSMHYDHGLVERTETFLLFGLMLLLPGAAPLLIWIFNALMAGTAIIRFIHIISYAQGLDGVHEAPGHAGPEKPSKGDG